MHILMDNSVWIAYFEACLQNQYRTNINLDCRVSAKPKKASLNSAILAPTGNGAKASSVINEKTALPTNRSNSCTQQPPPLISAHCSPTGKSLVSAHHNDDELLLMETVEFLTDENMLVTNDVVLAELTPYLRARRVPDITENKTALITDVLGFTAPYSIEKRHSIEKQQSSLIMNMPLAIDWEEIARFHTQCAQAELQNVNLTDLLVTQSALQNQLRVFSFKPQFQSLQNLLGVDIMQYGYTEE